MIDLVLMNEALFSVLTQWVVDQSEKVASSLGGAKSDELANLVWRHLFVASFLRSTPS